MRRWLYRGKHHLRRDALTVADIRAVLFDEQEMQQPLYTLADFYAERDALWARRVA